jgi:hypothetical protein
MAAPVKTLFIDIWVLLLIGCESSQRSILLTSEQAQTIAFRLANQKAGVIYHCQPFQDGQPAYFVQRHWVWSNICDCGAGAIQARIELAADGSTNDVQILFLASQLPLSHRIPSMR